MVRAKFKLTNVESFEITRNKIGENGKLSQTLIEKVEARNLTFRPVYPNDDPNHENSKFWQATPSGELKLQTVNPEAWNQFVFGKEYYLDFTPVE